jgi:hypothetical protein
MSASNALRHFDKFTRKLMLNVWKNSFGSRRFLILDWWRFKLKFKLKRRVDDGI